MPRNSDTFWSRVLFKDFIRHFRKMSPEQIAEDITESMDALDDLNPDGDSFGSLMVRWANERMNGAFATAARENGKKGGRPRKNQETTADGDIREDSQADQNGSAITRNETRAHDALEPSANHYGVAHHREAWDVSATDSNNSEARQSRRTVAPSTGATSSTATVRSLPMPTTGQLYDFARAESLDEADARDWYEMTVVDRDGKDRNGNRITNWKAACKKFCVARAQRRTA